MDMKMDQAKAYLVDPLMGPEPSDDTGLNSHFTSTFAGQPKTASPAARQSTGSTQFSSNNPFRNSTDGSPRKAPANVSIRPSSSAGYPTPPASASPHRSTFAHRHEAFGEYAGDAKRGGTRSRRSSSLTERYPGDMSHKPLDMIRRDSKKAQRSPHLRRHHQPGPDTVDRLDNISGGPYHHEGPYDAALLARNTSYESSPVAAVRGSNEEALRATPRENIQDAVERHRPLDGVAVVPPGEEDRFGRRYLYREGSNMMIAHNPEGGAYKRWAELDYHPDDIKGKGEPAYSLSQALKKHDARGGDGGEDGMEMQTRRSLDQRGSVQLETGRDYMAGLEDGPKRSSSLKDGMKKRFGSLRRRKD